MNEDKKVTLHIKIADEDIVLKVDEDSRPAVRQAENSVTELYNKWKLKFPSRSDKELLAMISYQFAFFYNQLVDRHKAISKQADDISRAIDDLMS